MTSQWLVIRGLLVVSVLSAPLWGWGLGEDEGRPAGGVKPLGVTGAGGDTQAGLPPRDTTSIPSTMLVWREACAH